MLLSRQSAHQRYQVKVSFDRDVVSLRLDNRNVCQGKTVAEAYEALLASIPVRYKGLRRVVETLVGECLENIQQCVNRARRLSSLGWTLKPQERGYRAELILGDMGAGVHVFLALPLIMSETQWRSRLHVLTLVGQRLADYDSACV